MTKHKNSIKIYCIVAFLERCSDLSAASNYDALTVEQLVELACNGDDGAMAKLIFALTPIARAKAAAYDCCDIPSEDLIQEGMLGFISALRTFSAEKETSFKTYADTCIGNRIKSAVRSSQSGKTRVLTKAISLDDDEKKITISDTGADPQEIVSCRERFELYRQVLDTCLSSLEKEVVGYRIAGKSYTEIATILNTTEKAVDNALQRVKKKLRAKI